MDYIWTSGKPFWQWSDGITVNWDASVFTFKSGSFRANDYKLLVSTQNWENTTSLSNPFALAQGGLGYYAKLTFSETVLGTTVSALQHKGSASFTLLPKQSPMYLKTAYTTDTYSTAINVEYLHVKNPRRTQFELNRAEREAHIYEGLKIAIDHIDEVIQIIRSSANVSDAREKLQSRFGLSEAQSQAIVDMTLGRLSGLERQKIEERLQALYALIEELKGILADESKLTAIIKEDLQKIKDRYGDERRTSIEEVENEILIEDLIDRVSCVVTVTSEGYIKRLPSETYQAQRRGGKGVTAMTTKEEDYVKEVLVAHSHDYLLMFSNRGRLYIKKCYEIPEAGEFRG